MVGYHKPVLGDVDAIKQIRHAAPTARIIMLTTYDGDEDIYRALQAGAKGYVLKHTPRDELLDTIWAVHARPTRIPPAVAATFAERVLLPSQLSERELDVLRLIVAGHSNKQIGAARHITEGTVNAHVNNIFGKLGVSDRTLAVTTALQRGIVHLD